MSASISRSYKHVLASMTLMLAGCMPDGFLVTPVPTSRKLVETTLAREGFFAPKIAVIDVDGVLSTGPIISLFGSGENPVSLLLEKLDLARADRSVKAVILRINSPGGTVAASELMHNEITSFRERTGKPVVAVMLDTAASGGYYIACACDEIVAQKSTVTGSIGVVMQLFDVTSAMAKIGIKPNTIKSGELKAAGSPFEKLSDKDRDVFQGIIDEMYTQFVSVVSAGRPDLTEDRVREIADGRVYTAAQALELGLIDRIATLRDVVGDLKCRIGTKHVRLVAYSRPIGYMPNYYAAAPATDPRASTGGSIRIDLPAWLAQPHARFMYLWVP
jgi:protease IV